MPKTVSVLLICRPPRPARVPEALWVAVPQPIHPEEATTKETTASCRGATRTESAVAFDRVGAAHDGCEVNLLRAERA
jgi:hypothetical protein